jgi:hypothetical protein
VRDIVNVAILATVDAQYQSNHAQSSVEREQAAHRGS